MTSSPPVSPLPAPAQDWAGDMGARWLANLAQFESMIAPIGEALLAHAAYRPGERVVDIGCGGGATSFAIARKVGPEGEVLGIDVSPDLVADTSRRAAAAGIGNVRFVCADAGSFAWAGEPFDRLCSRFGSMFFADPIAAFGNLRGLLKPGARIDLAVWGAPADNPWMTEPMQIVRRYVELPDPAPRAPGPFALADVSYLQEILAAAGFHGVSIEPVDGLLPVAGPGATPSAALGFMLEGQSFGRVLAEAGADARTAAADDLLALFARHDLAGAGVMMRYQARLVTALAR